MLAVTKAVVRSVTVVAFTRVNEPDTPDAHGEKVLVEFHP